MAILIVLQHYLTGLTDTPLADTAGCTGLPGPHPHGYTAPSFRCPGGRPLPHVLLVRLLILQNIGLKLRL